MSRTDKGEPIPMSYVRRENLAKELRRALTYDAPFKGERIIVTCVRIDGDLSELVCVIEATRDGSVAHLGADPNQARDGED